MTEREQAINLALNLIEETCNVFHIALFVKEIKGKHVLAIKDGETGKDYYPTRGDSNE
ncbi:MAG: hypothetical protein E6X34_11430 [Clostridium sp.]|uniref:hypothetical protein n=1 Tax=Clostridium sp. TaxID=1506 RepID=UPI002906470B|nr:hypothetical protein [Clostridium sp.]MDU4939056.1 hypothetical protein [Clostridium sp.]